MITKKDLKIKHGDDIILLFKGAEPFTEGPNNSVLGMLVERDGKVLCNECGKWFTTLAPHIKKIHKMSADEYKDKYGINRTVGLCSKKFSSKMSDIMTKRMKHEMSQFAIKEVRELGHEATKTRKKAKSMQYKNNRRTCPEQIKQRLMLLVAKFGGNPSSIQALQVDQKLVDYGNRTYGNWNNFKRAYKVKVTDVGKNNLKKDADLIYDLRDYVEEAGKLPWKKIKGKETTLDAFPHCKVTYRHHFGSILKAYAKCGIVQGEKRGQFALIY